MLSGERAESDVADHSLPAASRLLEAMAQFSSGVGLVPEQAWENPDLDASPFGTDPTVASIGFTDGKAAGSASPLTWAQAQELRLMLDIGAGRALEQPAVTADRYVNHAPPGNAPVSLAGPAPGSAVSSATVTVTGSTVPGASVVVESLDTTTGAASDVATATAGSDGSFSADVPVGFGDSVITVSATASGNRTGYAQTTVTSDAINGTTALDVTDPAGDDNGPGTYAYPTSDNFHAGAFDLTRFQVVSDGTTVFLRATLANLDPTFGSALGAQLLDVFVHQPGGGATSTAAPFPAGTTRSRRAAPGSSTSRCRASRRRCGRTPLAARWARRSWPRRRPARRSRSGCRRPSSARRARAGRSPWC